MKTKRHKQGFTLIELMITVVIVAILATIAVSMWGRYAYRARRADGQNLLLHIAQAEERYYTDYNKYTLTLSDLGYTTLPVTSEHDYYQVSSLAVPAGGSTSSSYIATVKPINGQANDVCGNLSIDNAGNKLPASSSATANSNGSCW